MQDVKEQLIGRLARLDMSSRGDSSGLVFTSELFNKHSSISFYERIALERAHRVGADAVYFKHYIEASRAPVPQIYIFDFLDKPQDNLGEIHKNVWSSTDVRLYFIVTKSEIKIYNSAKPVGFDYEGNYLIEPYDVLKLASEAADKFELYTSRRFDTGEFWQDSKNEFSYNNTAYERLVTELKNARRQFLNGIHLESDIANKLLVLSILVKYLEERIDVDINGHETRVFAKDFFNQPKFGNSSNLVEVIRNGSKANNTFIISLFDFLGKHFHGEIFSLSDDYISKIRSVNLDLLADFLSGEVQDGQFVLWKLYSFNHLPIELISSIYEEFLEADSTEGVAYTPAYLVNLLVDECMPLNEPKSEFKVLDPACGSGIFLVSVFKRLVDWWRVEYYEKNGIWLKPNRDDLHKIQNILRNSIFGIDIAPEAVNLAIFSLSLTLCDMLSPTVIWEDLKFKNLSNNIASIDFFKWIGRGHNLKFDLIIGNPPFIQYGEGNAEVNSLLYKSKLGISIPKNQSSLLFTIFSSRMMKVDTGRLCFILPAGPLLYNNTPIASEFRKYFFTSYNVLQIIDFTFISNSLFKNKGNEKNVAVAAVFIENSNQLSDIIYHVIAKKLKTISQRHYFEFDHYDFHIVRKDEAVNSDLIWKANLLGGGRLYPLLERASRLPTLGNYLNKQHKEKGWDFGDGFIKGKADTRLKPSDIGKGKGEYKEADFLTGSLTFEPSDFSEHGIAQKTILDDHYFQWPRKPSIFKAPLLLIKKNIGITSIPVHLSQEDISFKNEVIGIHCHPDYLLDLESVYNRIHNNSFYRFYILTTSGRSGVSRSTQTTLQKDIMALPFPEREEDIVLSYADEIVVSDTLEYWLDFLSKDVNIKMLSNADYSDLHEYSTVFCTVLNSLFSNELKQYRLKSINLAESSAFLVFVYTAMSDEVELEVENDLNDNSIHHLLSHKAGANHRVTRIVKYYEEDSITLFKPIDKRYWLKSIALRDADETIKDLHDAGY